MFVHELTELIRNLEKTKKELTPEELEIFLEQNSDFVNTISGLKESDYPILGFYQLRNDIF